MKHMSALSPFNPACQHIFIPHRCDLSLSHTCTASYSSHADLVSKRVAASSWLVELLMDKHQLTSLTFYSHTSSAGTKTKGHQALLNAGCMWSLMQCSIYVTVLSFRWQRSEGAGVHYRRRLPHVLEYNHPGEASWNISSRCSFIEPHRVDHRCGERPVWSLHQTLHAIRKVATGDLVLSKAVSEVSSVILGIENILLILDLFVSGAWNARKSRFWTGPPAVWSARRDICPRLWGNLYCGRWWRDEQPPH